MPDRVRAKLFVSALHRQASTPDSVEVEFGAVTRGDDNKTWAEATPSASFRMTIQNPEAATLFRHTGQEFYVDFTPAEQVVTLADCDGFVLDEHSQAQVDRGNQTLEGLLELGYIRCARCRCRPGTHNEPLRSQTLKNLGLV